MKHLTSTALIVLGPFITVVCKVSEGVFLFCAWRRSFLRYGATKLSRRAGERPSGWTAHLSVELSAARGVHLCVCVWLMLCLAKTAFCCDLGKVWSLLWLTMLKKEKPMMSVTAIIQGAQAQHSWNRGTVTCVCLLTLLSSAVSSEG